jgi:hypothetical protein
MATREQNDTFIHEMLSLYPLDNAIDWIQTYMAPEDVFTEDQLKCWATENVYVEEGEV